MVATAGCRCTFACWRYLIYPLGGPPSRFRAPQPVRSFSHHHREHSVSACKGCSQFFVQGVFLFIWSFHSKLADIHPGHIRSCQRTASAHAWQSLQRAVRCASVEPPIFVFLVRWTTLLIRHCSDAKYADRCHTAIKLLMRRTRLLHFQNLRIHLNYGGQGQFGVDNRCFESRSLLLQRWGRTGAWYNIVKSHG